MKNKNPVSLIIIGIILLLVGGGLYLTSGPNISAADQARCEELVQKNMVKTQVQLLPVVKPIQVLLP